jgi:hypothetical protein
MIRKEYYTRKEKICIDIYFFKLLIYRKIATQDYVAKIGLRKL